MSAALQGLQIPTVNLSKGKQRLHDHCTSSLQGTMQSVRIKRWIGTSDVMILSKL